MSYHNTSSSAVPSSARQSTTNAQGQVAPPGYHYMPDGTLMSDAEHASLYGGGAVETIMNEITNIEIDVTTLSAKSTVRSLKIEGDRDAVFTLEIKKGDGKNYNFVTDTFTTATTSQTQLSNQKVYGTYKTNIVFPSVTSAETYTIYVWAIPGLGFDTKLAKRFKNEVFYQTIVGQAGDVAISFRGDIGTLWMSGTQILAANSTGTSSKRYLRTSRKKVSMSFALATTGDADDAGFVLTRQPIDSDFYWSTIETVDGTTSSSTSVVVDDLSNLVVGMDLVYKTGTTAAAANTKITAIDIKTKTLTLSVANSLGDGNTMTFRAYGSEIIRSAIGIGLEFSNLKVVLTQLTNTLRTAISGDGVSADLNGTSGIAVGASVRCRFLKSQHADGVTITGVTQHTTNGSIELTSGSLFTVAPVKAKIYIDGSSNAATLTGDILIDQYPENDSQLNLKLDNIFTRG